MSDTTLDSSGRCEARSYRPTNPADLAEALERAFDYRGDVTLELRSGERIEGYIFNRCADDPSPSLQMYLAGDSTPRRIRYAEIVAVMFTGEDTASGKSWEAWVKKKESFRKAEADRIAADARARGHL